MSGNIYTKHNFDGIRLVVAAFGILCGLTGIIAGYFEIQQGNVTPEGFVISTIGPNYIMADDFTYFAVTIIPNFFLTGILAIIFSCLVILWSVRFVHTKHGTIILIGLSIAQMLVGGGWVIDLATIMCIISTRIDKPLRWWDSHLPSKIKVWLAKLFPVALSLYAVISIGMLALTILGVNDVTMVKPMEMLATAMFVPIILMIFGGISRDIQRMHEI